MTYYIPLHRRLYGDTSDPDRNARLVALWFRHGVDEPGRYDGVSEHEGRIRVTRGCGGKGSGGTWDLETKTAPNP